MSRYYYNIYFNVNYMQLILIDSNCFQLISIDSLLFAAEEEKNEEQKTENREKPPGKSLIFINMKGIL